MICNDKDRDKDKDENKDRDKDKIRKDRYPSAEMYINPFPGLPLNWTAANLVPALLDTIVSHPPLGDDV